MSGKPFPRPANNAKMALRLHHKRERRLRREGRTKIFVRINYQLNTLSSSIAKAGMTAREAADRLAAFADNYRMANDHSWRAQQRRP